MATHLKVIQEEKAKGKSASKLQEASEELADLMTFNQSITQVIARSMQDLPEFIFINMVNVTLLRSVTLVAPRNLTGTTLTIRLENKTLKAVRSQLHWLGKGSVTRVRAS